MKRTAVDLTGQRFGRLLVLAEHHRDRDGVHWLCCCDCGRQAIVNGRKLRSGSTVSCGCERRRVHAAICRRQLRR